MSPIPTDTIAEAVVASYQEGRVDGTRRGVLIGVGGVIVLDLIALAVTTWL